MVSIWVHLNLGVHDGIFHWNGHSPFFPRIHIQSDDVVYPSIFDLITLRGPEKARKPGIVLHCISYYSHNRKLTAKAGYYDNEMTWMGIACDECVGNNDFGAPPP